MTHTNLTILATSVEVVVPLIAVLLFWQMPSIRPKLAVILGACTPFFVTYALVCAAYPFRDVTNPHSDVPFEVAQRMSLWPYFATLVVAISIAIWARAPVFLGNYFLGLVAAPIGGFIVLAVIGLLRNAV